jgi:Protein of unknown function (DUF3037)
MKKIAYTYCVVRYVHDPAAGEMLNIGVLLFAPETNYLGIQLESRYERLSGTFAGFDGENYKRVLRQLENAVATIQARSTNQLFPLFEPLENLADITRKIWPDEDLSFRFGVPLAGVATDPAEALSRLFDRLVVSQCDYKKDERRSDEHVWADFQPALSQQKVHRALQPKAFEVEGFEIKFEHSFKNERWHVLQPVSLDYARVEGIRNRVTRLLGDATALQGNEEIGKVYLLLGKPTQEKHQGDYEKAKKLLHKMPVEHELVEANRAQSFAHELAHYMREHGVISGEPDVK